MSSAADPRTLHVEGVDVRVKRSARTHRLILRFSHSRNEIVLTVPDGLDLKAADGFLARNAGWIRERVSSRPEQTGFSPGALIPLRGIPHRIEHRSLKPGVTVDVKDERGEPIIAVYGTASGVARRVRAFLVAEAQRDFRQAVGRHAAALGAKVRSIRIKDTTSRWGSCTSGGALSFSWRLIMAPAFVLDYLAAHEVAHLREMNHSHRFWKVARELCPRLDEAESWLDRNGKTLHHYG